MAQLQPGDVIDGRYRIERPIGVGGMGAVYQAVAAGTSQRVAIKVLHEQLLRHPVIPKRFVQEAMAARALTTPHAVKVDGTGTLPDGSPYIVMEYLDGVDLGTLARQVGGWLPIERALRLADQVAAALEEAHARGILHRDLKPENVFVIRGLHGEMVKVVDFGISKILTREDGIKLTQTGTTLGTPQYMAVEQLRGAPDLDGRVDVYALGVMLYEVLAGARPYDGFTYEEVILRIATTTPAPLMSYRADIPRGLADVVERAMARDREQRIASMTALRQALAPYWNASAGWRQSAPGNGSLQAVSRAPAHEGPRSQPGPKGTVPMADAVTGEGLAPRTLCIGGAGAPDTPAVRTQPLAVSGAYGRASAVASPKKRSNAVVALVVLMAIAGVVLVLMIAGGAGLWVYFASGPAAATDAPDRSSSPRRTGVATGGQAGPAPTSTR